MCCTLFPSEASKTVVFGCETYAPDSRDIIHVNAYANSASSPGPNAMILPVPTADGIGPANVIDMSGVGARNILTDYAKAIKANRPAPRDFMLGSRGVTRGCPLVFDVGSYTLVTANTAADIPSALDRVPVARRPKMNQAIFDAYDVLYKSDTTKWSFILACWSGEIDAEPLAWQYKPIDASRLFFPALDGHDGKVPDVNGRARRDHTLVAASTFAPIPVPTHVRFSEPRRATVAPYFPSAVLGVEYQQVTPNGDFEFAASDFWVSEADRHGDRGFVYAAPPGKLTVSGRA
jgi:hypothetical protein